MNFPLARFSELISPFPWESCLRNRLAVLWIPLSLLAVAASAANATQALDGIEVADQPGPKMWRVSRDEHELWIIGTVAPTPVDLKWNSREVQAVVRESDEVLAYVNYGIHLGVRNAFTVMRYLPQLMKLRNNPDGALLRDLLPADQYARWTRLHLAAYGKPADDEEKWRPMFVADDLYAQTLKSRGLTGSDVIWPRLIALAGESKVPVNRRTFSTKIENEDPKKLLAEFRDFPRQVEIDCLVATMDHIEKRLPLADAGARAWSIGDIAPLQADLSWTSHASCTEAAFNASSLHGRMEAQLEQGREYWRGIVSYALLNKQTTVTALPIRVLLGPDSLLDYLRNSGFLVESPR
jgi:uncharacterized protein YbaP (TraB family)